MIKRILRRFVTEFNNNLPILKRSTIANGVIVSLTSYPARLKSIHVVIRSLLKQKVTAEKVILYLGIDTKENDITTFILENCLKLNVDKPVEKITEEYFLSEDKTRIIDFTIASCKASLALKNPYINLFISLYLQNLFHPRFSYFLLTSRKKRNLLKMTFISSFQMPVSLR